MKALATSEAAVAWLASLASAALGGEARQRGQNSWRQGVVRVTLAALAVSAVASTPQVKVSENLSLGL